MSRRPRLGARAVSALAVVAAVLVVSGCAAGAIGRSGRSGQAAAPAAAPARMTLAHHAGAAPAAPATVLPAAHPAVTSTAPAAAGASTAPATPCTPNHRRQLVSVDVHAQHVWMCAYHQVVFDSPVTTGAVGLPYDATPTGTFHVQEKDRNQTLSLVSGQTYTVKYWVPFDAPLFGFHDAGWQTMPFGSQHYRTRGSHGCIHMPMPAMRFLYRWAEVGATVRITA